jgi:thioredoxin reductase (NADPH)
MDENTSQVRLFGTPWSRAAHALRDFLHRTRTPYCWLELRSNSQAWDLAGVAGLDDPRLPVCIFPSGERLENPTVQQVSKKLGWLPAPTRREYDVCIYGAGPAGLSAAVYAASEGLKTLLVERYTVGGQAGSSARIENYLGFPEGISGVELAERARQQACKFGAELLILHEGIPSPFVPGKTACYLDDGLKITSIVARTAIYATGVAYRRLELEGEKRFFGAGLCYGAGPSEAALTEGQHVFVLGGGNSAGQAALHFCRFAAEVTLVVRGASLAESMSDYLLQRLTKSCNVNILLQTEVVGLHGGRALSAITLRDKAAGREWEVKSTRVFVCFGGEPNSQWAADLGIARDPGGYILTGPDLLERKGALQCWPLERIPYYLETSIPGIFAAGDVRAGSIKRVASAVGEGAMAVTFAHRYLALGNEGMVSAVPVGNAVVPLRAGMAL